MALQLTQMTMAISLSHRAAGEPCFSALRSLDAWGKRRSGYGQPCPRAPAASPFLIRWMPVNGHHGSYFVANPIEILLHLENELCEPSRARPSRAHIEILRSHVCFSVCSVFYLAPGGRSRPGILSS